MTYPKLIFRTVRDKENIVGEFTNENPETIIIVDFFALKANGYEYKTEIREEKKTKGITKGTPENIRFDK